MPKQGDAVYVKATVVGAYADDTPPSATVEIAQLDWPEAPTRLWVPLCALSPVAAQAPAIGGKRARLRHSKDCDDDFCAPDCDDPNAPPQAPADDAERQRCVQIADDLERYGYSALVPLTERRPLVIRALRAYGTGAPAVPSAAVQTALPLVKRWHEIADSTEQMREKSLSRADVATVYRACATDLQVALSKGGAFHANEAADAGTKR